MDEFKTVKIQFKPHYDGNLVESNREELGVQILLAGSKRHAMQINRCA